MIQSADLSIIEFQKSERCISDIGDSILTIDIDRLLLKLGQARREINRNTINPEIRKLALTEIEPILQMVAEARAAYVKALFDLANNRKGQLTKAQIQELATLREAFEETRDRHSPRAV